MKSTGKNLGRLVPEIFKPSIRGLSGRWRESLISPHDAVSIFGFGFGVTQWHHLTATIKEFESNPEIALESTSVYKFLTHFCPSSISSVVEPMERSKLPLFVYPWGAFRKTGDQGNKDPLYSRFCGPSTAQLIDNEFENTKELYKIMRREGYRPNHHSYIGGTWLTINNKKAKFVVLQGNHRMAALSVMGEQLIKVRTMPGYLSRVEKSDSESWESVKCGACTKGHAIKIFDYLANARGSFNP